MDYKWRIEKRVKCPKCKWDHRCCIDDCDLCHGVGQVPESVAQEYELVFYSEFGSSAVNAIGNFKCEWLAKRGDNEI